MSNKLQMRSCASVLALCAWTMPAAYGAEDMVLQTQSVRETAPETRAFDIPAQPLSDALIEFSAQSGQTVIADPAATAGLQSTALKGDYPSADALSRLLGESRLNIVRRGDAGFLVRPTQTARLITVSGNQRSASLQQTPPHNENDAGDDARNDVQPSRSGRADQRATTGRDELIVTGTSIRGIAPESSPTRTFSREDIQISGAATAQDFIRTLPSNFGGGSNESISSLPNDINAGFNGSSNGSYGSGVNLRGLGSGSTLVLLNGRRLAPSSGIGDFADISMIPASALERIEVLTDGASSIYGADAVAGVVNFILRDDFEGVEGAFRYGTVTQGDRGERRASVTSGTSWEDGNILAVYEYFSQDNLSAADRVFSQSAALPNDLLPSQERHSIVVSAAQEIASNIRLEADTAFSRRSVERISTDLGGTLLHRLPVSHNFNANLGGLWNLSDEWDLDFSGSHSRVNIKTQGGSGASINREIDSTLWAGDAIASGTLITTAGGDVKLAIGGRYQAESFSNFLIDTGVTDRAAKRNVYAGFAEAFIPIFGDGNALPAVRRLEINVSGRYEKYSDFGTTANPKVGLLWSPIDSLKLRGSYSTSFKPPPLGRVGATDSAASALRTSYLNTFLGLTPGDASIEDVVVLTVFGTSTSLDAERSRAFTAGLNADQQWGRHTLALRATWFDIKFEGRLGSTPLPGGAIAFDAPNIAFNNPDQLPAGTVIFMPAQNDIAALIANLDLPLAAPGGIFQDPYDAEIINFAPVVRNLSLAFVTGVDFGLDYAFDTDAGRFVTGLHGSYLTGFRQQAAATTPLVEQKSTLFNPVDLKVRANAGYAHNGLTANVFLNYTDGYRVDNSPGAGRIGSWTTVDVSLSYDTQNRFRSALINDTVLRFSVQNVFDQDPPLAPGDPAFGIFGYDPTNASPLGRFVALELSKRF